MMILQINAELEEPGAMHFYLFCSMKSG